MTWETAPDPEPSESLSPTGAVLQELALFGHRPFADAPDPRPLPEAERVAGAVSDMADALVATLSDTRLEPDLEGLLWSLTSLFHRTVQRIERELDDNEVAQRRSQRSQDGSEVRSVELEELLAQGLTLLERREAIELFRDCAAAQYKQHLGHAWLPRTGSLVRRGPALTASVIDSREFLAARRRAEQHALMPEGTRIAVAGGADFGDHRLVWDTLDKVRARHGTIVLLHGGTPKGAERIAACWALDRGVPQIAFRPDWARHQKAAPFKRNDRLLDTLPKGVIIFPGSGIVDNLADKARKMGIPVWRVR